MDSPSAGRPEPDKNTPVKRDDLTLAQIAEKIFAEKEGRPQ